MRTVSMLEEVLVEEYERLERASRALAAELAGLLRGSVREGLARRKVVEALKEQERSCRQIEKALERGFADEHAGA